MPGGESDYGSAGSSNYGSEGEDEDEDSGGGERSEEEDTLKLAVAGQVSAEDAAGLAQEQVGACSPLFLKHPRHIRHIL